MKTHCNCWIYSNFKVTTMHSLSYLVLLVIGFSICNLLNLNDVGVMAEVTTFSPATVDHRHHIISFVGQKRKPVEGNPHKFERIVKKLGSIETDDLIAEEPNTLADTAVPSSWDESNKSTEVRRSIPVLEPVRHLLNTVRDGGFNHTISRTVSKNPHHHLFVPNDGTTSEQNESSAIETEEEREMVNESNELQFLDFAGRFGAKLWGFFTNLQRLFAASSGSASSALSSTSFGQ